MRWYRMKIDANKMYQVTGYTQNRRTDYGQMQGADVLQMIKGYTYDAQLELWYTPKASKAIDAEEINQ